MIAKQRQRRIAIGKAGDRGAVGDWIPAVVIELDTQRSRPSGWDGEVVDQPSLRDRDVAGSAAAGSFGMKRRLELRGDRETGNDDEGHVHVDARSGVASGTCGVRHGGRGAVLVAARDQRGWPGWRTMALP